MLEIHKEKIKDLLKNQRFAVIATEEKNVPYTNLVAFFAKDDLKKIYFPTSKKTRKYSNLNENSMISLLVDNRGNTPQDIKKAKVVTATGKANEIYDKKIVKDFLKKHPYLKSFVLSKDTVMIEILIENYTLVDSFQNVNVLSL